MSLPRADACASFTREKPTNLAGNTAFRIFPSTQHSSRRISRTHLTTVRSRCSNRDQDINDARDRTPFLFLGTDLSYILYKRLSPLRQPAFFACSRTCLFKRYRWVRNLVVCPGHACLSCYTHNRRRKYDASAVADVDKCSKQLGREKDMEV